MKNETHPKEHSLFVVCSSSSSHSSVQFPGEESLRLRMTKASAFCLQGILLFYYYKACGPHHAAISLLWLGILFICTKLFLALRFWYMYGWVISLCTHNFTIKKNHVFQTKQLGAGSWQLWQWASRATNTLCSFFWGLILFRFCSNQKDPEDQHHKKTLFEVILWMFSCKHDWCC